MEKAGRISTLFLDIGGVLLTNGWDSHARRRAVERFGLDGDELNERHHLTFDTYEEGKLSLDEYLDRVVFCRPRQFSKQEFKNFMFAQSQPFPKMIGMVRELKSLYRLKLIVVSNEGRELNEYRIREFGLNEFVDAFISSCFVHFRKPDPDIYRIALDISQVRPEQVAYIEDRPMFVEVACSLGLVGIHHTGIESTRAELSRLGLSLPDR
ncbi:MAG: HAD family phosphatase [Acidobacteriia bacterium]|nr:HAD family phosphatase [Terriglobia bacterium]